MDLLSKLRKIANDCAKKNGEEKYKIIVELLSMDDCFFHISFETAISILGDLGFSDEEAKSIYKELIGYRSYEDTSKRFYVK